MNPTEQLLDLLRDAARMEARIVSLKRSRQLSKSADSELYATEYSASSIMDDLVKAFAAQQLAAHIIADLETLPKVTA